MQRLFENEYPQDILVGSAAGVLVMFLTGKLIMWLESHPDKDIPVAVIGIAITVAAAVFSAVKPYPADFDANGNLLVDGLKMANDTFKGVGWMTAFFVGWVLERRFVRFTTEGSMQQRFFRLTGGLLGYYIVSLIINPMIKTAAAGFAGTVVERESTDEEKRKAFNQNNPDSIRGDRRNLPVWTDYDGNSIPHDQPLCGR